MKRPFLEIRPDLTENEEEHDSYCGRISKNEIKKAVKRLTNGKASCGDNNYPS